MAQCYYGSICMTDLIEKLKTKHSAFTKGQNGKIYCNVNIWLNDQEDKYGNVMAVQLNSKKESKDAEGKVYIGNCKKSTAQEPRPVSSSDINDVVDGLEDSLPF